MRKAGAFDQKTGTKEGRIQPRATICGRKLVTTDREAVAVTRVQAG